MVQEVYIINNNTENLADELKRKFNDDERIIRTLYERI